MRMVLNCRMGSEFDGISDFDIDIDLFIGKKLFFLVFKV